MFALVLFAVLLLGAVAHEVVAFLREESWLDRRRLSSPEHDHRHDREVVEAALYPSSMPVSGPR